MAWPAAQPGAVALFLLETALYGTHRVRVQLVAPALASQMASKSPRRPIGVHPALEPGSCAL
jgi:hypothetical protein